MSLKSRKRANKSSDRKAPTDLLILQKRAIRNVMLEYLGAAALPLVFAIVLMILQKSVARN